jgi:hypothetical protein
MSELDADLEFVEKVVKKLLAFIGCVHGLM